MVGKQTSSPSSPHKSIASPPPPSSSPSVVIDDDVNNSFLRIDDGVVAVLVVRRVDCVVVRNDKTDPDLPCAVDCTADESKGGAVAEELAARAVDCPANESKGGAVAELAARNVSNPGNGGRLVARAVASPLAPKYGSIGGAAAASAGATAPRQHWQQQQLLLRRLPSSSSSVAWWVLLGVSSFRHKKQLSEPSLCRIDIQCRPRFGNIDTCPRHSWLSRMVRVDRLLCCCLFF